MKLLSNIGKNSWGNFIALKGNLTVFTHTNKVKKLKKSPRVGGGGGGFYYKKINKKLIILETIGKYY